MDVLRLPVRGKQCWVAGAGPREGEEDIHHGTGLGDGKRQGGAPVPRVLSSLGGKPVSTGPAPPYDSPLLSHLRKLSPLPSSSSLSVAMTEFLAGRGEPLLNDLSAWSLRGHSYQQRLGSFGGILKRPSWLWLLT